VSTVDTDRPFERIAEWTVWKGDEMVEDRATRFTNPEAESRKTTTMDRDTAVKLRDLIEQEAARRKALAASARQSRRDAKRK
jgi:hypothetical protein